MTTAILPGATIGILGSGQLGRMLAQSARQHGYRVAVFSDTANSPAAALADEEHVGRYDDVDAVRAFSAACDVITFEFENVTSASAKAASESCPVRPSPALLHVAQHRLREKTAAARAGVEVTPYQAVASLGDLSEVTVPFPAILKTATEGYDGKGQRRVDTIDEAREAFAELGSGEQILESFVRFTRELSVVVARGLDGALADFGVFENTHENHVLDVTLSPARITEAVETTCREVAHALAVELDLVGVMCVELFETAEGKVLFNEIAPRPHNTGHLTIEAFETSQFEQQLRAVCGLPLGATTRRSAGAAMANLFGDLWSFTDDGSVASTPHWERALAEPAAHLHLYGKAQPKPGRKMGHLTVLSTSAADADTTVRRARAQLA